jgi:hypothetical protein
VAFDVFLAIGIAEERVMAVEAGTISVDGDIGEKELISLTAYEFKLRFDANFLLEIHYLLLFNLCVHCLLPDTALSPLQWRLLTYFLSNVNLLNLNIEAPLFERSIF